jgi:hypothetical protein
MICKNCKKKHSPSKGTIFENVRFGIVKAMNIVYDIETSNEYLSSVAISKKYEITQKTAWGFIQKVNSNKKYIRSFMNVEIRTKKSILSEYKSTKEMFRTIKLLTKALPR